MPARTVGWLIAGLVLGAAAVAAVHPGHGSSTTSSQPTASGGPAASTLDPRTGGFPAGGAEGGREGRIPGEQHVFGVLTAVTRSTLTLTSAAGSTTYTIDASTALVKDGRRVSSLSQLRLADTVLVHVYPYHGRPRVEVVIDGESSDTSTGT